LKKCTFKLKGPSGSGKKGHLLLELPANLKAWKTQSVEPRTDAAAEEYTEAELLSGVTVWIEAKEPSTDLRDGKVKMYFGDDLNYPITRDGARITNGEVVVRNVPLYLYASLETTSFVPVGFEVKGMSGTVNIVSCEKTDFFLGADVKATWTNNKFAKWKGFGEIDNGTADKYTCWHNPANLKNFQVADVTTGPNVASFSIAIKAGPNSTSDQSVSMRSLRAEASPVSAKVRIFGDNRIIAILPGTNIEIPLLNEPRFDYAKTTREGSIEWWTLAPGDPTQVSLSQVQTHLDTTDVDLFPLGAASGPSIPANSMAIGAHAYLEDDPDGYTIADNVKFQCRAKDVSFGYYFAVGYMEQPVTVLASGESQVKGMNIWVDVRIIESTAADGAYYVLQNTNSGDGSSLVKRYGSPGATVLNYAGPLVALIPLPGAAIVGGIMTAAGGAIEVGAEAHEFLTENNDSNEFAARYKARKMDNQGVQTDIDGELGFALIQQSISGDAEGVQPGAYALKRTSLPVTVGDVYYAEVAVSALAMLESTHVFPNTVRAAGWYVFPASAARLKVTGSGTAVPIPTDTF